MRNCCIVIEKMMEVVPVEKADLLADLQWNHEDAYYKAPEETLQWHRTMQTLIKHIPTPVEPWEFEVLSIFTTKSVDQLRQEFV